MCALSDYVFVGRFSFAFDDSSEIVSYRKMHTCGNEYATCMLQIKSWPNGIRCGILFIAFDANVYHNQIKLPVPYVNVDIGEKLSCRQRNILCLTFSTQTHRSNELCYIITDKWKKVTRLTSSGRVIKFLQNVKLNSRKVSKRGWQNITFSDMLSC